MHPVAWKKICRPKSEGGIGIRRTQNVNAANMAKLDGKLLQKKKKKKLFGSKL